MAKNRLSEEDIRRRKKRISEEDLRRGVTSTTKTRTTLGKLGFISDEDIRRRKKKKKK